MSASSSILNQVSSGFPSDCVYRIAGWLGENPARTRSALGGALPALLDGVTSRAETTDGANTVLDMIKTNHLETGEYANAASAVAEPDGISHLVDAGRPMIGPIFGQRSDSVIDSLASLGRIKRSSSSSLLSLAAPVVLSAIAKQVSYTGWNANNLKNLLTGQRNMEQDVWRGTGAPVEPATPYRPVRYGHAIEPAGRESNWWKWALALLALILLLYLLTRTRVRQPEVTTPSDPASAALSMVPSTNLGPMTAVMLPDRVELNIPTNGVESRLIGFIQDPNRPVDHKKWFSFDRLEFNTDSDVLKPGSEEQIRNIAEIMSAYPNVNLKIGGYTDDTGDETHNLDLSQRRADTTMNEIANRGIERSRLAAEGYGSQYPVADNSTAEGRDGNRGIDLRVAKK